MGRIVFVAAILQFTLVVSEPEISAAEALPARIDKELRANALATRFLTVEFSVVYSSPLPQASALERIKQPTWFDFAKPDSYRLILQESKWLLHSKLWVGEAKKKTVTEVEALNTFDGDLEYNSNVREWGSVIGIKDKRYHESHVPLHGALGYNYFLANVGLSVPSESVSTWLPLESTILYMLRTDARLTGQTGNASATQGDYKVVVSTTSAQHHYYLDLGKHCAIRVHEERSQDGKLKYRTENSLFQQLNGTDCWIATAFRTTCYTWQSIPNTIFADPVVFEDVRVTKLSNTPHPDSEFVVDWKKPGNLIGDSRVDGADKQKNGVVDYRVPADLSYLDEIIDAAANEREFIIPIDRTSDSKWLLWGSILLAISLFVAIGVRWRRT